MAQPRLRTLVIRAAALVALALISPASGEESAKPKVEIGHGIAQLPEPVQEMLLAIGESIRSGDLDQLKVAIEMNEIPPVIGDSESNGQIAYLKSHSADAHGAEALAKLSLILDAGYAHVDPGGKDDSYVWPYLAKIDLATMAPADRVRLYRVAPGAAGAEMEKAGIYSGWRLGISPTGVWHFLETGPVQSAQPATPE
ncbi:MAG: hypothetical protein R3D57_04340 [Hyphomicrobiaceae bacterium]